MPDLVQTPWNALEIEYCTSNGDTKVWRTTESAELEELRALMAPAAPKGLTMILTRFTNELVSGQRCSFVVDVSEAFYSRLASVLAASGGDRSL